MLTPFAIFGGFRLVTIDLDLHCLPLDLEVHDYRVPLNVRGCDGSSDSTVEPYQLASNNQSLLRLGSKNKATTCNWCYSWTAKVASYLVDSFLFKLNQISDVVDTLVN